MNENQFIIIQGPTKYFGDIIDCYKNQPNVIVSTFNYEPPEALSKLSEFFLTVTIPFDFHPGLGNLNCQSKTTSAGLYMAKKMGATHALKLRSDMIVSNVPEFMKVLQQKPRLSFLAWHYDGYLVDYLNYGPIDEMIEFWDIFAVNSNFAEKNLMNHFYEVKQEQNTTFENIKTHVDFFLEDLIKMDIHIYWLKYNIYISEYYKHECYKYK